MNAMNTMKNIDHPQLQGNVLSRSIGDRADSRESSAKQSDDSEFDLELVQARLAAQPAVVPMPEKLINQGNDQASDKTGEMTVEKTVEKAIGQAQVGDKNPLSLKSANSIQIELPTVTSRIPTLNQTLQQASTELTRGQADIGKMGAQIHSASELDSETGAPNMDSPFDGASRLMGAAGTPASGNEKKMLTRSGGVQLSSGHPMGEIEIGARVSKEKYLPTQVGLPLSDLNSDSSDLNLAQFDLEPSQSIQESSPQRKWVSGNDFLATKNTLVNTQVIPNPLKNSEQSESMLKGADPQNLVLAGGASLLKPMIKEKPLFGSELSARKVGAFQAGSLFQELKGEKTATPLIPGAVTAQKQALPQILMKERVKEKLAFGEEQSPALSLDSSTLVQVPGQLGSPPELASKQAPKSEVTAQVLGNPGRPERLAPEGLSNMGLGILRTSYQGGGEIRVRLRPDHLGELNIRVLTDGNRVALKIQASDERSKKILEESLGSLKQNLSAQNLSLGTVDLSVAKNDSPLDMKPFQGPTEFLSDSGQGRNQNNSQPERFYEDQKAPRQEAGNSLRRSGEMLRNMTKNSQGMSRLDVMV